MLGRAARCVAIGLLSVVVRGFESHGRSLIGRGQYAERARVSAGSVNKIRRKSSRSDQLVTYR